MPAPDSLWLSGQFVTHVDVLIERPLGSGTILQSLRNFGGLNWIKRWNVEHCSAQQPIGSGSVTLHRQAFGKSLAPLVTSSTLNLDGGLYAPSLDFGREIEVRVCNLPLNTEPTSGDWITRFQGITDDPAWAGKSGDITLPFRDRSGPLADTQIREKITYGSEAGVDAAVVMQAILDRWMGIGDYVLEDEVTSYRYMVTDYTPYNISVWEALEALALVWGGIALRQTWKSSASEFRLTVMEPDREKTDPDYSIPQSTYIDIPVLSTGSAGFRNIVKGITNDAETGEVLESQLPAEADVATDPLVLKYGERALTIIEDSSKGTDTRAELDRMVARAYADVSGLTFPMEAETKLAPFAELDQIVTWGANQVLFDNPTDGAVIGLKESGDERGKCRTRWVLGSRPVATVRGWTQRDVAIKGLNAAAPETIYELSQVTFDPDLETDTHLALVWQLNAGQAWGAVRKFVGQEDDLKWAAVAAAVEPVTMPLMVVKPTLKSNEITLIQLESRYEDRSLLLRGNTWRRRVDPAPAEPPVVDTDWTETDGSATVWWSEKERGVAVTGRAAWLKMGADLLTGPDEPTRGPGDASTVLGGALGTGQYEYDFPKDPVRTSTPLVYLTLDSNVGEVLPVVFPPFDPDTQPTLGRVDVEGRTIIVRGADSDTRSLRVERADVLTSDPAYYTAAVDATYYDFVVPDPGAVQATYRVTAYADPVASVTTDTAQDVRYVMVDGTTFSPGSEPTWTAVDATAPDEGSDILTLSLQASSAPGGYTATVEVRQRTTGSWGPFMDITGALAPTLTAPPTSLTVYSWASGLDNSGSAPLAQFEFRATISNGSGDLKATADTSVSYYYGFLRAL